MIALNSQPNRKSIFWKLLPASASNLSLNIGIFGINTYVEFFSANAEFFSALAKSFLPTQSSFLLMQSSFSLHIMLVCLATYQLDIKQHIGSAQTNALAQQHQIHRLPKTGVNTCPLILEYNKLCFKILSEVLSES